MYTMASNQVREDLEWMAARGTDAVTIAVLEQDLFAAIDNIEHVCAVTDDLGDGRLCRSLAVGWRRRWSPKVPSLFAACNPHIWMRDADGEHYTCSASVPAANKSASRISSLCSSVLATTTRPLSISRDRRLEILKPLSIADDNSSISLHSACSIAFGDDLLGKDDDDERQQCDQREVLPDGSQ